MRCYIRYINYIATKEHTMTTLVMLIMTTISTGEDTVLGTDLPVTYCEEQVEEMPDDPTVIYHCVVEILD
jgi:hypothetical protein